MSTEKEPIVHIQEHKRDKVKFILENVDLAYANTFDDMQPLLDLFICPSNPCIFTCFAPIGSRTLSDVLW